MDKYVVALYQKCLKTWTVITKPLSYTEAKDAWIKKTDNGKHHAKKHHGDYFKIKKLQPDIIVTNYNK